MVCTQGAVLTPPMSPAPGPQVGAVQGRGLPRCQAKCRGDTQDTQG